MPRSSAIRLSFLALAAGGFFAAPVRAQVSYTPVAVTGQPAPGVAGATFSDLLPFPTLGPGGEVGFLATLTGSGVTASNDRVLYQGPPGSLALVAREGDAAPGAGARVFGGGFPPGSDDLATFEPLRIIPGGAGAFIANTVPPGQPDAEELALYTFPAGAAGGPRLVAREGDVVPGTSQPLENVAWARVNNAGNLAFRGDLAGGGDASGVFAYSPVSGLRTIAMTGQPAPGTTGAAATFGYVDSPALNSSGRVAFGATLTGAGGGPAGFAVYAGAPEAPAPVARTGDAAPGAAGATFETVFNPTITDSGLVAFGAQLAGPGVGASNSRAVYFGTSDAPQLVARAGQAVVGTDAVVSGLGLPAVNSAGQFAITGAVQSATPGGRAGEAVFAGSLGDSGGVPTLRLLARDGDAVPGLSGYTFNNAGSDDTTFGQPTLNGLGQVAFGAVLDDGTGAEVESLFATDPAGNLHLVARQGQQVLLAPGDVRVISGLTLVNYALPAGEGGMTVNFNDAGRLAFHAYFTDGSQAILVAAVPEPGAGMIMLCAGLFLLARRRVMWHGLPARAGDVRVVGPLEIW